MIYVLYSSEKKSYIIKSLVTLSPFLEDGHKLPFGQILML